MVIASVALLVLAFGPGAALAWAATAPASRARYALLSASPALTLGLIASALGWSGALDLGWSALTILVLELALAALAVIARLVRHRPVTRLTWPHVASGWARRRRDLGALAGAQAIVLGIGVWLLGRLTAAPGWDAMNHGFMARMLMDHGAVAPGELCATGSTHTAPACEFYPLAPHVLWVQTAELTGQPLSRGLLATAMVLGPSIAVLGVFVIARYLGAATSLAFAAASACGLVGPIWQMLDTGRITAQLGAALSPVVAMVVFLALRYRRARAVTVLSGVALGGLLVVHTYDVVLGAVFGIGLLLTHPVRWRPIRRTATILGSVLLGILLVVGPQWKGLLGAGGQRSVMEPSFPGDLSAGLWYWLSTPRYIGLQISHHDGVEVAWAHSPIAWIGVCVIVVGALLGVVASLHHRWRWLRPFALTYAFTLGLAVYLSSSSSALRDAVGSLFYGSGERVFWAGMLAPAVLSVAGWAAALSLLAHAVRRRLNSKAHSQDRADRVVLPLASVVALLLVALVVVVQPVVPRSPSAFAARTPTSPAYGRVAHWLTGHLRPGAVVADDLHRDFVTWMAIDQQVPVLVGMVPITEPGQRDWEQRQRVWRVITGIIKPSSACLDDPYDVQFVVTSTQHMPFGLRSYKPSELRASPYLTLVHRDGPLRVYAVRDRCGPGRPSSLR